MNAIAIREDITTLMNFPLGQRLLKAGFASVTTQTLDERFCCKKITDEYMKKRDELYRAQIQEEEERIRTLTGKHKLFYDRGTEYVDIYSSRWRTHDLPSREDEVRVTRGKAQECVIKSESLDSYVAEAIPDRCLELVQYAKKLGAQKFFVRYPVMQDVPQKDPVIVVELPSENPNKYGNLIEISMWE